MILINWVMSTILISWMIFVNLPGKQKVLSKLYVKKIIKNECWINNKFTNTCNRVPRRLQRYNTQVLRKCGTQRNRGVCSCLTYIILDQRRYPLSAGSFLQGIILKFIQLIKILAILFNYKCNSNLLFRNSIGAGCVIMMMKM